MHGVKFFYVRKLICGHTDQFARTWAELTLLKVILFLQDRPRTHLMQLSLVCPSADFSSWFFALFSLFAFARTEMQHVEESEVRTTCRRREHFLILKV